CYVGRVDASPLDGCGLPLGDRSRAALLDPPDALGLIDRLVLVRQVLRDVAHPVAVSLYMAPRATRRVGDRVSLGAGPPPGCLSVGDARAVWAGSPDGCRFLRDGGPNRLEQVVV